MEEKSGRSRSRERGRGSPSIWKRKGKDFIKEMAGPHSWHEMLAPSLTRHLWVVIGHMPFSHQLITRFP